MTLHQEAAAALRQVQANGDIDIPTDHHLRHVVDAVLDAITKPKCEAEGCVNGRIEYEGLLVNGERQFRDCPTCHGTGQRARLILDSEGLALILCLEDHQEVHPPGQDRACTRHRARADAILHEKAASAAPEPER